MRANSRDLNVTKVVVTLFIEFYIIPCITIMIQLSSGFVWIFQRRLSFCPCVHQVIVHSVTNISLGSEMNQGLMEIEKIIVQVQKPNMIKSIKRT